MTTPPPLVGIAANPSSSFRRTGEVGRGSDLAAVRRNSYAGSFATFVRRSSESLPSSPDAGPACIIGKELSRARSTRPTSSSSRLVDVTADSVDIYLRERLRTPVLVKMKLGYKELRIVKSTTVLQEFRVLRRMLNVAVRKKLLAVNPCAGVEFPVAVKGLFRPHYVAWSEQQKIESNHYGDRVADLQGTDSDAKRPSGSAECGGLGYRIRRLQTARPKFPSPRSPSRLSRIRWRFRVKDRICFRAI